MDIQISSNFERYLFEASGRDASLIRDKMRALAATRHFDLGPLKQKFDRDFAAAAASEQDVADAISRMKSDCGYLIDPHTACGIVAADQVLGSGGATPQVVLSTAHPAKFPDVIEAITGKRPPLPEQFATLLTARERITSIPNDLEAAKSRVEELTRVAVEGRG
jgi:threonine synthase